MLITSPEDDPNQIRFLGAPQNNVFSSLSKEYRRSLWGDSHTGASGPPGDPALARQRLDGNYHFRIMGPPWTPFSLIKPTFF